LTLTVLAGNRRQAQVSLQGLEDELGLGPSVAKPSETGMQVARRRRKKVSKSESPRESSRSGSSSDN
jgi:hypothetical protein